MNIWLRSLRLADWGLYLLILQSNCYQIFKRIIFYLWFIITAVSDITQPAMSKMSLGVSVTSIKLWRIGTFSPSHLSGPLRKQKVMVCDLWLVDLDPFCVFLGSLLLNFRVWLHVFEKQSNLNYLSSKFFLSSLYWNMASLDFSYRASKSRRNTEMGGWKHIGMFLLTFCSLLLPILFDKHGGCYGNSLIDFTEKPKILKRSWQFRSAVRKP